MKKVFLCLLLIDKAVYGMECEEKRINSLHTIAIFGDGISAPLPNFERCSVLTCLFISKIPLPSLPDFPQSLRILDINRCQLKSLPNKLPFLNKLRVDDNDLLELPDTLPESLSELSANNNQLTALPNKLPSQLQRLSVCGNKLTKFPSTTPRTLTEVFASSNKFKSIDSVLYILANQGAYINVEYNPFTVEGEQGIATFNTLALKGEVHLSIAQMSELDTLNIDEKERLLSLPRREWPSEKRKKFQAWNNEILLRLNAENTSRCFIDFSYGNDAEADS